MKKNNKHNDLGFKVPDGYFDNLTDRLLSSHENSSPVVEKHPFKVPDTYFETLENRILESTIDKPVVQLESDHPAWIKPLLAVAAIVVLAIAVNGFWQGNSLTIEDLESEELAFYLAETDFTTDDEAIEILYADTDVLELEQATYDDIDQELLLDYLSEEVDLNQMMEE
jgi:hypothetical protein